MRATPDAGPGTADRVAALTGLRALAALLIVATHAAYGTGHLTDGYLGSLYARLEVGVPIFFALSGYLLFRPWLIATRDQTRFPSVRRYARHRVRRIMPAYVVTVLAAFADVVATQVLTVSAAGSLNPGEARAAYALQIPTMGISGAGLFHHSPSDTADKISVDYLGPVIESYRSVIESLMDTEPDTLRAANALANALAGDPIGFQCPGPVQVP